MSLKLAQINDSCDFCFPLKLTSMIYLLETKAQMYTRKSSAWTIHCMNTFPIFSYSSEKTVSWCRHKVPQFCSYIIMFFANTYTTPIVWHTELVFFNLLVHMVGTLFPPPSLVGVDVAAFAFMSLTNTAEEGWTRCPTMHLFFKEQSPLVVFAPSILDWSPSKPPRHCRLTHRRYWKTPPWANVLSFFSGSMCQWPTHVQ